MRLPSIDELRAAAAAVHRVMPPTPQIRWPLVSERTGAEVWIKHENHTPVGAFKIRGGVVYMENLRRAEPNVAGVIAATRGNHGQSVAFAAIRAGLRAVIVVPHGNSREKNAAMRALGAELVEHGNDFQEAYEYAAAMAQAQARSRMRPERVSRRSGSSCLLSFKPRTGRSGESTTAAATTGPKSAPRPTSSTPAMARKPRARNSRSSVASHRNLAPAESGRMGDPRCYCRSRRRAALPFNARR